MRRSVHQNVQSVRKMDSKRQQETCTICLELIDKKQECQINCGHKFCFTCIDKWCEEAENVCPLCKKSISKIKHQSVGGETLTKVVEERNQNGRSTNCEICNGRIRQADIAAFNGNSSTVTPNMAVICDCCGLEVVHVLCLCQCRQVKLALSGFWLCEECNDYVYGSENSSESEEQKDQVLHLYRLINDALPNPPLRN